MNPGAVEVGITDYAQSSLGDMVSTELPEIGTSVKAGVKAVVVESTKAASDVESPVSGKVTANNAALADNPELINDDPYGKGWLYRVALAPEPDDLLSATEYARRSIEFEQRTAYFDSDIAIAAKKRVNPLERSRLVR